MILVNEKICIWSEMYYFNQNEYGVEKMVYELSDSGQAAVRLYDVDDNNISEKVKGEVFKTFMQAIQKERV